MRHLFVADPPSSFLVADDTTIAFMREAARRGHGVESCLLGQLGLEAGRPWCDASELEVSDGEDWFRERGSRRRYLGDYDVVWMRKDPPFDLPYLYATQLLSLAPRSTLLVNEPRALRDANEKLFAQEFPDLCPRTLVTSSIRELDRFRAELGGEMIVKPLAGAGGEGVFHITVGDRNARAIVEAATAHERLLVMAQQYIPQIREGDKRIILVEGEPHGAVLRVPAAEETRANFHAGGQAAVWALRERDREICAVVGPRLREMGVLFAGIDVIGDFLTEINVTSPTGIRQIRRLGGPAIEVAVLDAVERQAALRRASPGDR